MANGVEPACPTCYVAPTEYSEDIRTTETSKSAYLQYRTTFDWNMPLHIAAGVRYEQTEVESQALVRVPTSISWNSLNEFNITYAEEGAFVGGKGKYDYVLPNVDLKLDITEALALRGSYSRSIGRPGWTQIDSGRRFDNIVRTQGGTGLNHSVVALNSIITLASQPVSSGVSTTAASVEAMVIATDSATCPRAI